MAEMWVEFVARGGTASIPDLDAFIAGLMPLGDIDVQMLDVTLHEIRDT
ncbi:MULTISPECIES: hypothetical protein [Arthrobacter]|nr:MULTISPECIES: hypothetical protein [Arthrobacter]MBT8159481.1 hypothetical protein [Arthrobacter sp. GN70]